METKKQTKNKMNNGRCSVKNCKNQSEIILAHKGIELCDVHWSEYCDGKKQTYTGQDE